MVTITAIFWAKRLYGQSISHYGLFDPSLATPLYYSRVLVNPDSGTGSLKSLPVGMTDIDTTCDGK